LWEGDWLKTNGVRAWAEGACYQNKRRCDDAAVHGPARMTLMAFITYIIAKQARHLLRASVREMRCPNGAWPPSPLIVLATRLHEKKRDEEDSLTSITGAIFLARPSPRLEEL
jgi:hypothetical protein